jgi:hypothetical protein
LLTLRILCGVLRLANDSMLRAGLRGGARRIESR